MNNDLDRPETRAQGPVSGFSRRRFLQTATVAGGVLLSAQWKAVSAEPQAEKRYKILGFSKPFQKLNFDETADLVAEVGWDGIECPVRKAGHVLPERVEEDLPKLVDALKRRGKQLVVAATDVRTASEPLTERVLRTLSKLGIKQYRLAHLRYNTSEPIPAQLDAMKTGLRELTALNRELGLSALYQNHSGRDYVGAAVWDLHQILDGFDQEHFGVCFDIGHATVEGGLSWPTDFRLIQPWIQAVFLKDFAWKRTDKGWDAGWCPLGAGMVDRGFFALLRKTAFTGPIVQHHEYPLGNAVEMSRALKQDFETLRGWLRS
jgi:sugar phosphate isomerase/epimerase